MPLIDALDAPPRLPFSNTDVAHFFRRGWGIGIERGIIFALDAGGLLHEVTRALVRALCSVKRRLNF